MQGAKAALASTQYWNLERGDFDALVSSWNAGYKVHDSDGQGIYWANGNILGQWKYIGPVEIHWASEGLRFSVKSIKWIIKLLQLIIINIATWHLDVVIFTHGEEMFHLVCKLNL